MLEPVVPRYRGRVKRLYFRGDAAFANPVIYEFLKAEDMRYAIRISAFLLLCRFQHFWKSQVSTTAATRGVIGSTDPQRRSHSRKNSTASRISLSSVQDDIVTGESEDPGQS